MFQGLSNFANLLKNAREIQNRASEMRDRLAALRVQGTAGGGMVAVEMSGDQRVTKVSIDPVLLGGQDRELVEELVLAAVNQALENVREQAAGEMAGLTEGLGLPGMDEALSKFGIGNPFGS